MIIWSIDNISSNNTGNCDSSKAIAKLLSWQDKLPDVGSHAMKQQAHYFHMTLPKQP
jgi:hypothetical protein